MNEPPGIDVVQLKRLCNATIFQIEKLKQGFSGKRKSSEQSLHKVKKEVTQPEPDRPHKFRSGPFSSPENFRGAQGRAARGGVGGRGRGRGRVHFFPNSGRKAKGKGRGRRGGRGRKSNRGRRSYNRSSDLHSENLKSDLDRELDSYHQKGKEEQEQKWTTKGEATHETSNGIMEDEQAPETGQDYAQEEESSKEAPTMEPYLEGRAISPTWTSFGDGDYVK